MAKQRITRTVGLIGLGLLVCAAVRSDYARVERSMTPGLAHVVLQSLDGKSVRLPTFKTGRLLVLVFTGTDCPIGNLYMSRLVALNNTYAPRGVRFVGINSNSHESLDEIAAHAKEYSANFPILKDPANRLADMLGVERTCEVIVFDRIDRICYHGAIDDQYVLTAHRDRPTREYLVEALEAVLSGREVVDASEPVVGCPIDRVDPNTALAKGSRFRAIAPEIRELQQKQEESSEVHAGPVTFASDVAPILQAKCQPCHRPGQVGRFSLTTYAQARRWATSIHEVVDTGRMPPWHADPRYGKFENDRSLTPEQRATLIAWVEQGSQPGQLAEAPAPRTFSDGWTIGEPDQIFEMPEEYLVPPSGTISYQHFRVKTGFAEDRWIQAVEARPGCRAVVHHIVVYVDNHKWAPNDPMRYVRTHLVSYAPGDLPSVYPPGTAKLIPAGSDLLFEVHYTPVGTAMTDRSSIGLVFAKEPVTRRAYTTAISDHNIKIPPGDPNYESTSAFTFPSAVHLLGFMPHMHLRGKDFRYTAVYPDGRREILLSVPAFDFAWQSIYRLKEPMAVPAGTRIECLAHFDNSAGNLANPDPTKKVVWGEQSWDEMMIGFLDFAEDRDGKGMSVTSVSAAEFERASRRVRTPARDVPPYGTGPATDDIARSRKRAITKEYIRRR